MPSSRTSGHRTRRSVICRAVVWAFEEKTLWGKLAYAIDERGYTAIDAISAALIAKHASIAREIRLNSEMTDQTVKSIDFHSTSIHGLGSTEHWPSIGQLVEVHLNVDKNLVAVWY